MKISSGVAFVFSEVEEPKKIDEEYDLRTEIGKGISQSFISA